MRTTIVKATGETNAKNVQECTCGSSVWRYTTVTKETPYPRAWTKHSRNNEGTWPWIGGILVSCVSCDRTWYGVPLLFGREYDRIVRLIGESDSATLTRIKGSLYPIRQPSDTRVKSTKRGQHHGVPEDAAC